MANFEKCLKHVFEMEGGYSNHKDDTGGATNFGITQEVFNRWCKKHGSDSYHVNKINKGIAADIYKEEYWDKMRLDELQDEKMALMLFDQGVNCGIYRSTKRAQNIANYVAGYKLATDGKMGAISMAHLNDLIKKNKSRRFMFEFVKQTHLFYAKITRNSKKNKFFGPDYRSFIVGWTKRANRLLELLI